MTLTSKLSAAAIVLLCATSQAAFAASTTATLGVSAIVTDACIVTAPTALVFGNPSASAAVNESIAGNIVILCTAPKTGVTVTFGAGNNAASGQRQMTDGGTGLLPYNVFSDSGHSSAVAVGGTFYSGNIPAASPVQRTVYGQIPAGSYTAGAYLDTIIVTLNY